MSRDRRAGLAARSLLASAARSDYTFAGMQDRETRAETQLMRLASTCLALGVGLGAASALAAGPKFLEKQGFWSIYIHDAPNDRICFASVPPRSVEPKGAKRRPAFLYVTHWRKDKVQGEVSVQFGYTIKADVSPTIMVGSESFELYARNDKAFMRDPQEEKRLLDAMLKAQALTVQGAPAKGAATTDSYSLDGLAAAIRKLDQHCQ